MEPPSDEPEFIRGSAIIRWSVSFFCLVLIVLGVSIMINQDFHEDEGLNLRRITAFAMIILVGLSGLGAIWGSILSARFLALLFGGFGLFYLIDEWVISSESILAANRYASGSNPLNAVLYFLLIALPCLLYAFGCSRLLEKYLVPGCLIFILYAIGAFTYAIAKIFDLRGWQHALVFLPLMLLISWFLARSIRLFFRDRKRGWRIGCAEHISRTYEERIGKKWVSILLRCEGDVREPPLLMRMPTREEWKQFAPWTEDRHPLIMERIRGSLDAQEFILMESDATQALERESHNITNES